MPHHAVHRPVFECDVMRGQVPVEAAIGDPFPTTAFSLLLCKSESVWGSQEGKAKKEKICKNRKTSQMTIMQV